MYFHNSRDQTDTGEQNAGWSELWDSDQSDLWDRGKPSPALVDFVEQKLNQVLPHRTNGQSVKVLVPVSVRMEVLRGARPKSRGEWYVNENRTFY